MNLPRFLARRRMAKRFAERWRAVESEFAQGVGSSACPPASPPGPPSSRSGAYPAHGAADGTVAPTEVPIPLRPSVGASIAGPCVICGAALSDCSHGPVDPGAERIAGAEELERVSGNRAWSGGRVHVRPIPPSGHRTALGVSAGPAMPQAESVTSRSGRPPT